MKRPPTDFELLRAIHERHHRDYLQVADQKLYLAIDVPAVADDLGVATNSVYGRLYHHLDKIYGDPPHVTPRKFLFSPKVGHDVNVVNFALLEAVLAGLWQQRDRDTLAYWTSVLSIVFAALSLTVSAVAIVVSVLVATDLIS